MDIYNKQIQNIYLPSIFSSYFYKCLTKKKKLNLSDMNYVDVLLLFLLPLLVETPGLAYGYRPPQDATKIKREKQKQLPFMS